MKKMAFRVAVALLTFIISLAATASIAHPYAIRLGRESALKQQLRDLRKAIDQYAADKEHLPGALEDLVSDGYILKVPIDPITNADDWKVDIEEDTISRTGGQGIVDVHSSAAGESSDGLLYGEY